MIFFFIGIEKYAYRQKAFNDIRLCGTKDVRIVRFLLLGFKKKNSKNIRSILDSLLYSSRARVFGRQKLIHPYYTRLYFFFFLFKLFFLFYSRSRTVCAQYYVKSEHYRRQARPAVVVVGELGVHLHLFYTVRIAHDHVLVRVDRHDPKVEIYQTETATEHAGQYEQKVSKCGVRFLGGRHTCRRLLRPAPLPKTSPAGSR